MSAESERIDRMLSEGKISPDEAQRLRAALDKSEPEPSPLAQFPSSRISRLAVTSAVLVVVAFAVQIIVVLASVAFHRGTSSVILPVGPLLLLSLIFGISALVVIKKSQGRLTGRGLALFGVVSSSLVLIAVILLTA